MTMNKPLCDGSIDTRDVGHDIKRVPLDFDWPLGKIWPGYLLSLGVDKRPCTETILLCMHKFDGDDFDSCRACRHFGRLAGLPKSPNGRCPVIEIEPPTGDGWQRWEMIEGSPITPVFRTAEELARCLVNGYGSLAPANRKDGRVLTDHEAYEQALAYINGKHRGNNGH